MQTNHKTGRPVIGVMGGGNVASETAELAYQLGAQIAREGWILLNGGRNAGVMAASAAGAKDHGGITVGILPDEQGEHVCPRIDIPIITGMGNARNCINVLSSDVIVACHGGTGTLSEIALALKSGKPVILLKFKKGHCFPDQLQNGQLLEAETTAQVIGYIKRILGIQL